MGAAAPDYDCGAWDPAAMVGGSVSRLGRRRRRHLQWGNSLRSRAGVGGAEQWRSAGSGAVALRRKENVVPGHIQTGDIHHVRLTVTDVARSREFYTSLLGFEVAVESPPEDDPSAAEVFKILFGGIVMTRGNLLLGLRPMAPSGDRFDPDRVGLDHLSFSVTSRDELEVALRLFEERGVVHGAITTLPSFGIDVLPFEDPDGVQLELTAPAAG